MLHGRMLRYLDEIARCGSIRKAAGRLNIASSAVNRHLLELEDQIGSPLFERLPRGLRLTAAGEMLINHVRKTLKDYACVRTQIEALRGLQSGEVRVATMAGLADSVLGPVVERFAEQHPHIRLVVRTHRVDAGINAVMNGDADLLLGQSLPKSPRLSTLAILDLPLGAAMAPDHPLARSAKLCLADCLSYPLVVPERGTPSRELINSSLPPDADILPILESDSLELLKKMARRAPTITFLNAIDIEEDRFFGNLVYVPLRDLRKSPLRVSLVKRVNSSLGISAGLVIHEIQNRLTAANPTVRPESERTVTATTS